MNLKEKGNIYILPNMITTMNIFFGFFSIIRAIHEDYTMAAYAIIVAAVFDLLDGRVARMTRSTSPFGSQYDSLCDVISFGMAPSLLLFLWALQPYGRLGWLASFFYLACTALRLARFNMAHSEEKKTSEEAFFIGLPSPISAGIVASCVLTFNEMNWLGYHSIYILILTLFLGFSMVDNFPYRSFKDLDLRKKLPFRYLVISVLLIAVIAIKPDITLFVLFLSYATLGLIFGFVKWMKRKKEKKA